MLTVEKLYHQASDETLVYVKSSHGNSAALLAAFDNKDAADEFAQFLTFMVGVFSYEARRKT